jgi:hypothetical protein
MNPFGAPTWGWLELLPPTLAKAALSAPWLSMLSVNCLISRVCRTSEFGLIQFQLSSQVLENVLRIQDGKACL